MAIKVVVVDAACLPSGVDFPPLDIDKYGWEQYPQLTGEDIAERCWRADIVVTLSTAIDLAALEKMTKIGLLICAGTACDLLDQSAAEKRGVELLAFADAQWDSSDAAQDACNRITAAIDHYIRHYAADEVAN